MNRIFCTIITKDIRELADKMHMNPSVLNNAVSTWQSLNNKPGVIPTQAEFEKYWKTRKNSEREAIETAIPYYKETTNQSSTINVSDTGEILLSRYENNERGRSKFIMEVEALPISAKDRELIGSPEAKYILDLYAARYMVENGFDGIPNKAAYNEAIKAIKKYRKNYPDKLPNQKFSEFVTDRIAITEALQKGSFETSLDVMNWYIDNLLYKPVIVNTEEEAITKSKEFIKKVPKSAVHITQNKEGKWEITVDTPRLKGVPVSLDNSMIDNFLNTMREGNPYHQVFKLIVEALGKENIKIRIGRPEEMPEDYQDRSAVHQGNTIIFFPENLDKRYFDETWSDYKRTRLIFQVLTHELVHRLTVDTLKGNNLTEESQKFKDEITRLYKEAQEVLAPYKEGGHYGMSDIYEFIAEALSRPEFQRDLAKIKSSKKQSLWQRLVSAFQKLFSKRGINIDGSILADILSASDKFIKYSNELRSEIEIQRELMEDIYGAGYQSNTLDSAIKHNLNKKDAYQYYLMPIGKGKDKLYAVHIPVTSESPIETKKKYAENHLRKLGLDERWTVGSKVHTLKDGKRVMYVTYNRSQQNSDEVIPVEGFNSREREFLSYLDDVRPDLAYQVRNGLQDIRELMLHEDDLSNYYEPIQADMDKPMTPETKEKINALSGNFEGASNYLTGVLAEDSLWSLEDYFLGGQSMPEYVAQDILKQLEGEATYSKENGWNFNNIALEEASQTEASQKASSLLKGMGIPTGQNMVADTPVTKIISGAQTGVDTIGLLIAQELGIETGGTAPINFESERKYNGAKRVDDGVTDEYLKEIGVVEITPEQQIAHNNKPENKGKQPYALKYTGRTELNVADSDGTVYFFNPEDKGGYYATKSAADNFIDPETGERKPKPFIANPTVDQLRQWIKDNNIKTLNIAGNRGSKLRNGASVAAILRAALGKQDTADAETQLLNAMGIQQKPQQQRPIQKEQKPAPEFNPDKVPNIGPEILEIDETSPRAKLARDFTPVELYHRVTHMARRFSEIIDADVEELIEQKQMEAMQAQGHAKTQIELQIKMLQDPDAGRRLAISMITFNKLYEELKADYQAWADKSVDKFNEMFNTDQGQVFKDKYARIMDNFDTLFETACNLIEDAENVKINFSRKDVKDSKVLESTNDEDKTEGEFGDDENGNRATGNDGWSFQVRFVDPRETMSSKVRKTLSNIQLLDFEGEVVLDDLGNPVYVEKNHAHGVLLNGLAGMISPDDFMTRDEEGNVYFPLLERLAVRQPWVQQVITSLTYDENLQSLFYADFRKDFIPYWTQRFNLTTNMIETFQLNETLGADSTMTEVLYNYDRGEAMDENSIYDSLSKPDATNAEKGIALMDKALIDIREAEDAEEMKAVAKIITTGLRMMGFNIESPAIESMLLITQTSNEGTEQLIDEEGVLKVEKVIRDMQNVFSSVGNINPDAHLLEEFKDSYKSIAEAIGDVYEMNDSISFRDGDKTRQSYSAPNYISTMMKKFQSDTYRQEYIDNEFKQFEWFYDSAKGEWRNEWLNMLENDKDVRDKLRIKEIPTLRDENGELVEYQDWTGNMIKEAFVMEYFSQGENKGSQKQYAYYNTPIFSDSPVAMFIRFLRYTTDAHKTFKEKLRPLLGKVIMQEFQRIRLVEDRAKKGVNKIQNFDKTGGKFLFFPLLNNLRNNEGNKFLDVVRQLNDAHDEESINKIVDQAVDVVMYQGFADFMQESTTLPVLLITQGIAKDENDAINKLEEYYWNQAFATTQIIQLTTTDLAFYKDGVDFQKRYKEVYAAGTKLNTNSKYGKKTERVIYLADNILTSPTFDMLKANVDKAVAEKRLTQADANSILSKLQDINVADAQAYRTIESYRSVMDMMGLWTEEMDAAIERLQDGSWTMADFDYVFQTIKPFVFTQLNKPNGLGGRMKVSHQNKNSEFLLLATMSMIANEMSRSPKIKALNRFMSENEIDVSMFESAVKSGGQGIIDINYSQAKLDEWISKNPEEWKRLQDAAKKELGEEDFNEASDYEKYKKGYDHFIMRGQISQSDYNKAIERLEPSEEEVYKMLYDSVYLPDGNTNEEVLHEIPYDDYIVQQPTPEHLFDADGVFGSQFRNLIISDLPEDIEITVQGKKLKGRDEVKQFYQRLIVENLLEDYQKLQKKFATIEDLQKAILDIVKGNPKYGRDMIDALEIVEHEYNGEKVKVFNIPLHNPSTTTKIQEIINSLFKNNITKQKIKGGNAILVSSFGFSHDLKVLRGKDGAIKGVQCYLPFYTKKYFEPFMETVTEDGKTFQRLNVEKIREQDPDLLKLVGYRIPTEGKYSMLPLIIEGFLPQQNGSSIMLPAEITQLSGSDFDIDKLFLMIPEFKMQYYDMKAAREDFEKSNKMVGELAKLFNNTIFDDIDEAPVEFKEWFKENKEKYKLEKPRIRKVRYNQNAPIQDNNRAQRNNMIIDIAYGILTHPSTAEKINSPGSFDKLKRIGEMTTLASTPEYLMQYLEENGITVETYEDALKLADRFLKMDLGQLKKITKKYATERNPLSINTFAYFHNQNMSGGQLIGVYANNTTSQAKLQDTRLAMKDHNSFFVNGRLIASLHEIYAKIGDVYELISKNCAEFSAASVDNVKDPQLAKIMQNMNTANIAGFMLRAGMTIDEVGLMFMQPYVKSEIQRTGGFYTFRDKKFKPKEVNVTSRDLLANIIFKAMGIKAADAVAETQKDEIRLFNHIAAMAEKMGDIIQSTRADSPNGAMKRSIAGAKNQIRKVHNITVESTKKEYPFIGIREDYIKNDFIDPSMSIDEMREKLYSSRTPMLQAFYSLGIDFGRKLMKDYMIQLHPVVDNMLNTLYEDSPFGMLRDKVVEDFYNDFVAFGLAHSDTFGNDANDSYDDKRQYYLYEYPKKFIQIIADPKNRRFTSLTAIRKLHVVDGVIRMDRSGRLTKTAKEVLMRDFETLLYMDDESRKFAVDLMMYAYYQHGFYFGPNTFGNLLSANFMSSFTDVVNTLREMPFAVNPGTFYDRFLEQFYYKNYPSLTKNFYSADENPFSAPKVIAKGANTVKMSRWSVTNKNKVGEQVHTKITADGALYKVIPDRVFEDVVEYALLTEAPIDHYNPYIEAADIVNDSQEMKDNLLSISNTQSDTDIVPGRDAESTGINTQERAEDTGYQKSESEDDWYDNWMAEQAARQEQISEDQSMNIDASDFYNFKDSLASQNINKC